MSLRRTFARLVSFFRKQRHEIELDDEIRVHLEAAEDDALRRGLSPEQASLEARRYFGGIEQMKEEHRDRRGLPWLETMIRDFRFGMASLWRTPEFTAVVVGVLALGIGGTVAMFSIVDAVLLKPLPFPQPDRLVALWEAPRPGSVNATTVAQFLAWKRLANVFDAMAAEQMTSGALNESNGPTRLPGKLVTSEYFKVFAINAALGRTFTTQEDQPGAEPVLVLSHSAWQTYFSGDPGILHHRIVLDGLSYQVIGVLQAGAFDRDETKFWRPLAFTTDELSTKTHWLTLCGRLRQGVTLAQAREQMHAIYAALLTDSSMDEDREGGIDVELLSRLFTGANLRRSIGMAFGAVFLVLLIACANVANLLFARGAARKTELAVRAALGAGRGRLFSQLLTESLALCLLGGIAGVAVACGLLRLATPFLLQSLPFTADVHLNFHVLVFAATIVLGVTLLTGALPAMQASFGDLAESLKQAARGSSAFHIRVRCTIVIGEVALSLVLVSGALLLARSLLNLQKLKTGVRIDNVITASLDLSTQEYPTAEKASLFYEALSRRLRAIPGMAHVGISTVLPLHWISHGEGLFVPTAPKPLVIRLKCVDAGYFQTLAIPLLAGRGIQDRDREGSPPVIVINQALRARLADAAGIQDPVGKLVRVTSSDYLGKKPFLSEVQIVGIIRSERTASPGSPDPPVVYVPLAQAPSPNVKLLVHAGGDAAAILPSVRSALRTINPHLPLADIAALQQIRDDTLSPTSRPAWLIGAFASLAVFLSAVGLYGVVAYSVGQRRRELGIRMALGARSWDVLSNVLQHAMAIVGAGLALGAIGVYAATRVLRNFLFEISPLDPLSLVLACSLIATIGLLAGFLPARRAAQLDPLDSLRDCG